MRSGFEEQISQLLNEQGIGFQYEPCSFPYITKAYYTPDFVIDDIYIEVKGYFRPTDRRKMKDVKRAHPDLDIRMWFQRDNYLTKAKKSKYSDWATKNGFPVHVGKEFPAHWFKKG